MQLLAASEAEPINVELAHIFKKVRFSFQRVNSTSKGSNYLD